MDKMIKVILCRVRNPIVNMFILTLSKAVLVGAKTVNGPSPARVSTKPAAFTAVRRVENLGLVETKSLL